MDKNILEDLGDIIFNAGLIFLLPGKYGSRWYYLGMVLLSEDHDATTDNLN